MRSSVNAARPTASPVPRATSRRRPAAGGTTTPKPALQREPEEFPLVHDAATWDDDTFESGWDGDEAQLADDIARLADD